MSKSHHSSKMLPLWFRVAVSLTSWIAVLIATVLLFLFTFFFVYPVSSLFEKGTRSTAHSVASLWARIILTVMPFWKFKVMGKRHLKRGVNYLVVSNHQSVMDIVVALAGLPLHFKFLAKAELFPIPFLGWHMRLAGYIPVHRGSRTSGQEAIDRAADWLERGVSVLFFPEGTRSLDGQIHVFKPGAFRIAQKLGVEILPIVINGTMNEIGKPVVSVDIPSGLHSDTGQILGTAVKAQWTATLGLPKKGLYEREGPMIAGQIRVIDISLPKEILFKGARLE